MENVSVCIEGADRSKLIDALKEELDDYYLYTFDQVVVLTFEKYYFRVKSNLMGVIILNFSSPGRCSINLASGGGGEGLIGITWGSESSNNNRIAKFLKELCESNHWQYSEKEEQ